MTQTNRSRLPVFTIMAVAAALGVCPAAPAQTNLVSVFGPTSGEGLGGAVAGVGDIDGDNVPDFATGSWSAGNGTLNSVGRLRVFSGATGALIFEALGNTGIQQLSRSVAGVGDVDGDGIPDIAAGAPMNAPPLPFGPPYPPPSVFIFSGATHLQIRALAGVSGSDFGITCAGLGDLNGDGGAEVIGGGDFNETAIVFSGITGGVLFTVTGPSQPGGVAGDGFAQAVAGPGDCNGDGIPDFLIAARLSDLNGVDAGCVRLYSGLNGSLIRTVLGDAAGDNLGQSVSGVGDLNGDGHPDFVVGIYKSDLGGTDAGAVRAYSGFTGAVLWTAVGAAPADQFGYSVAAAGDVNGDGVPDVVVGTPTTDVGATNTGSVTVLSGIDGTLLGVVHGTNSSDLRGRSVAGIGDVDGDGYAEVVGGMTGWDLPTANCGAAHVISFGPFLGSCGAGNVGAGAGGPYAILTVNGSAGGIPRRTDLALGQSLTISISHPPGSLTPAPLALFGFIGTPQLANVTPLPLGLGTMCFIPSILVPPQPQLILLADGFNPANPGALVPGAPAPWSFAVPAGLPMPLRLAMQGVIVDGVGYATTNALAINVR